MTNQQPENGLVIRLRRRFSQLFWGFWQGLPISPQTRQRAIVFVFRHAPFLVSWSASYRNWKQEAERHAAQLALIAARREALAATASERQPRYTDLSALPRPDRLLARAIAFYLPQFHAIPENDRWWGNGFTEWTNVRRARPQYQGHRQPRRPAELGYYDLLADPSTRRRQAALAHQYGLEGFCFYFYWFGGKRLLDAPIRAYADDEEISLPFCLCWANESWSRRWDGREDQKLITQYHSPEDDIAFITHIADYLKSDKYLRVNGKPLVIVYRPDRLPDARATAERWRNWCHQAGIGEIFLGYTLSFASGTPDEYGFDAAIEFPPNNMGLSQQDGLVQPVADNYACRIYDLAELATRAAQPLRPPFKLFRGATPQWDNTARRNNNASIMLDGGPAGYERWLRAIATQAADMHKTADERIVFINAWNEWAEGAYLEPDLDWGYSWLAATRRALSVDELPSVEPADLVPAEPMIEPRARPKIIVVVHDLHRNGAQIHSLHLVAIFKERFGFDVLTIACGDGPLLENFETYGKVLLFKKESAPLEGLSEAFSKLRAEGFDRAIVNSSAGGWIVPALAGAGIECVGLVHELPEIIRAMHLEDGLKALDEHARHVVFASEIVRDRTAEEILEHPWSHSLVQPQGLYRAESILLPEDKEQAARDLRFQMGLPEDALIVVGAGFGDHRKGVDIFCEWAIASARIDPRLNFIWIGELSPEMTTACHSALANAGDVAGNMHLVGFQHDVGAYYKAACAYALSSREDPYPSTVLEALACGAPGFIVEGTTGLQALLGNPAIRLLPNAAPATFASALTSFLAAPEARETATTAALELIRASYGFRSFAGDLLRLAGAFQPRISVIVPNYNYARFLPQRIASILNQELPVWEIIFLDDASSDDSLNVAARLLKDCGIHYRIIPNAANSGSVFAQWQKGVDLARGDIVWIAEADDWAAASFTRTAAEAFRAEDVVLSYTQSNQVSQTSEILCPHYLDYVADIDRDRWRRPFVNEGQRELDEGLSVKNTIPNVSGVLFRREALADTLARHMDEIGSYRVAGDWCVYAHLATRGKIAFDPRPLNYHRRHAESVTISRFTVAEWDEIARMQARVAELAEITPPHTEKARAYLDELRKRL